jgi:hypothetical protein
MSAPTTTVRVRRDTREALNTEVAQSGTTADAVIAAGLRALRRERLRREWERDARLAGEDPEDRAEIAAAIRDLVGDDE